MSDVAKVDLRPLETAPRLLFSIPLKPLQGQRFQPTGFPSLGAATYQTPQGTSLLVESAQSMANRLEMTCWDEARKDVVECLKGLSYVRVNRTVEPVGLLTTSIHEAHRIGSGYILKCKSDSSFRNSFIAATESEKVGPVDRVAFLDFLLRHDIDSLIHGVFIADPKIKGGRLRLARALSAFIEADDAKVAASGGVKTDHVNPKGDPKPDFGMVPFARDEYTAANITLYVNLDLAQIRGYGLDAKEEARDGTTVRAVPAALNERPAERLLILLALFKLRRLLDDSLRLRTACDLCLKDGMVTSKAPAGFILPSGEDLAADLMAAIEACKGKMQVSSLTNNDPLKEGKDAQEADTPNEVPAAEDAEEAEGEQA